VRRVITVNVFGFIAKLVPWAEVRDDGAVVA
jgi:hypothetical protein